MGKPKHTTLATTSVLTLLFCLLLVSCSSRNQLPAWLIGKWSVKFPDYAVEETWKQDGDHFSGVAVWTGGIKELRENLRLFFNERNELVYRTEVDGKITDFVCRNTVSDTLLFVNNANDFPKRLHYAKASKGRMEVWIDNSDNDPNRILFHFQKID